MKRPCPYALRHVRAAIAVAVIGLSSPSAALADCPDATDFVSPGILASFDITHRWALGLGAEVSYAKWIGSETPVGPGAFLNAIHYFAPVRARFAAGAQATAYIFGPELGISHWTRSNEGYGLEAATGPYAGMFWSVGIVMLAIRGSFGDSKAHSITLDLGYKLPLLVTSSGARWFPECYDPLAGSGHD
jgi:hypothetical protein